MTTSSPPAVCDIWRSAEEIAASVEQRLALASAVGKLDPDPLRDAIVQVFAHYCEILIQRLNRAPAVHRLAFVDLLGITPEPPIPARVALSFKAAPKTAGVAADIVVPQHTQVAAPPAAGEKEAVLFETSVDLPVVRTEIIRSFAVDVSGQRYADVSSITSETGLSSNDPFADSRPVKRAWHISHSAMLGISGLAELRLEFKIIGGGPLPANASLEWGIAHSKGFIPLQLERDGTHNLSRSGEIIFSELPPWPDTAIGAAAGKWLTCRLRTSGFTTTVSDPNTWGSGSISRLRLRAKASAVRTPIQSALCGSLPLDPSRDFFPLGERPRFGDVFYVQSDSFAQAGAHVTIEITLTNPASASSSPIPPVSREGNPRLQWEICASAGWQTLSPNDTTASLTEDGVISFVVPWQAAKVAIAGREGGWLRARLVSGTYGAATPSVGGAAAPGVTPPSIAKMTISTAIELGPAPPERVILEGNLEWIDVAVEGIAARPFCPFPVSDVRGAALYLGLAAAPQELPGRTLSVCLDNGDISGRQLCRDLVCRDVAAPRWQVRGTTAWRECRMVDKFEAVTHPDIAHVQLGDDIGHWSGAVLDPKQELYWLRVMWPRAEGKTPVFPRRVALNAVSAMQAMHLENELLGSSNGRPHQVLSTARVPVLGEPQLEVREPEASEGMAGFQAKGSGTTPAAADQYWVPWSRVDDFSASDMNSRHFILVPLTGVIRFGDGRQGKIPPRGSNNIRLRAYSVGGGARGNRPSHAISQLRTSIPYIESVTNPFAATGGQDPADLDSTLRSAAARLRHRGRAVVAEDYADLARLASSEVGKAICIASRDLERDPSARNTAPGLLSVVVVPRASEQRPNPTLSLLERVKAYIGDRQAIGAEVVVLGPEYVSVCVDMEIGVSTGYSEVRTAAACEQALSRFLHPLFGGPRGAGWGFAQHPHPSDFYPLLNVLEGVDDIRALRMRFEEERSGALQGPVFLICSGSHKVQTCR